MNRYSHLNCETVPLCGESIPDDFEPGYDQEEECPCGCKTYEPSMFNLAEGFKPKDSSRWTLSCVCLAEG